MKRPRALKILLAAGIVLLLSGPLLVGWIYEVNPSDFNYNIAVPLFDAIVLGLVILGFVSLGLSRLNIKPRYATAIGIAFLLLPVAVFVAGSTTTVTACFGCNQLRVYGLTSVSCAGVSEITCSTSIIASGESVPQVTGAAIALGNSNIAGDCGIYKTFSATSETLRCVFPARSHAIGAPYTISISLSDGEVWSTQGNLTRYVQIPPDGVSVESGYCEISSNLTCGLWIENSSNESSGIYRTQNMSYTVEAPGMCEPAGCKAFTQQATHGICGPTTIGAKSTELVTCSFQMPTHPSGGGYDGTLLFTNGAELTFGGNFTS